MRVRLILAGCKIRCELREVVLRDKPEEMIAISPKATVPVLQLPGGKVIDESVDIAIWAISRNDPHNWKDYQDDLVSIVKLNDFKFKQHLDKYKYSSRNTELSKEEHRENANFYFEHLENRLSKTKFLSANHLTITDLAVFPFVRQFAFVDKTYFDNMPYRKLTDWLEFNLQSELFSSVMKKYTQWQPDSSKIYFP